MAAKKALIVLLAVTLSLLIEDTEAGWKFWKKDKETTTETPTTSTTTTTTIRPVPNNNPPPGSRQSTGSVNKALIGATNPGLAIGVGNSGQNVRDNARPQRLNPGTEVGQDFPGSRPANPVIGGGTGQGYRDWAVDLTGAGDPSRQAPRLPSTGPALSPGGSTPGLTKPGSPNSPQPVVPNRPGSGGSSPQSGPPASRPASPASGAGSPSVISTPAAQGNKQGPPALGPRPGSPSSLGGSTGGLSPSYGQTGATGGSPSIPGQVGSDDRPHVSNINVGPITPAPPGQRSPGYPSLPGSPSSPGASPPGGKTWAEVAGGGSRPGSPTPPPRSSGQPISGQTGGRITPGAVAGGLAGGAIGAAGLAANGARKTYSSNPIYSKGNSVTDEDLEKLSEALWIKDNNNAWKYITLNLQKQTSSSSQKDEAAEPLLKVKEEASQIPTIAKVLTIYDNYKLDTRENEYISPAQRNEESLLVDTFLSTNVMSAAMRFLADKGYIRKDYYDYKDTLRRMWFNLYSRGDGKIGSTGFEHVFLTELKLGTEVSGLHNWIYFNAEEKNRRADYLGYIKKVDLGDKAAILKLHAKFNNIDKPVTTMFIGTSPELEMALYTVCFFVRPEQTCPVSLGGTKFNIVTHKFRYRGYDLVGSAYPDI
ncbi:poly(U)-specific endoribonuclease homolog [Diachasma alloeum]|uniref:poly(U)-specific endoribonuclease homolog n=1 Tax=Diachasma alloeum TaxID=454923 RepID=UPI000738267E|nr:poly(U)-specific endoribonuclease homolog [Diachasma alloeum]